MTYKEFKSYPSHEQARLCRVTYQTSQAADGPLIAEVLEWGNSNAKWYRLEPYEGRKECGYVNEIWKEGSPNLPIVDVQILTRYASPADYHKPSPELSMEQLSLLLAELTKKIDSLERWLVEVAADVDLNKETALLETRELRREQECAERRAEENRE